MESLKPPSRRVGMDHSRPRDGLGVPNSFSWQLVQFNHHSLSPRLSPASPPFVAPYLLPTLCGPLAPAGRRNPSARHRYLSKPVTHVVLDASRPLFRTLLCSLLFPPFLSTAVHSILVMYKATLRLALAGTES